MTDKENFLKRRIDFFALAIEEVNKMIRDFFEGQQEDNVFSDSIKARIIILRDEKYNCCFRIENEYDVLDIIDGLDEKMSNEYEYRLIVMLYDNGYYCEPKERTDVKSVYEIEMRV